MLATQDAPTVSARMTTCSICQRSVRVNPLKATDVGVICRMCRCRRCSIPMSLKPCDRCGVAHGTPSVAPGLCERCHEASGNRAMDSVTHHHETPMLSDSDSMWPLHEVHADDHDREFLR